MPLPRNNAECQGVSLQPATTLSSEVWICTAPALALCDKDRASDRVTIERSRERGRHAKPVVQEPRYRPALLVDGLCGPSTSALQWQRRTSCPRLPGQVYTGARSRALCGSICRNRLRPAGHPALLSLVVYVCTYICIVMVMFMVLIINTLHRRSRNWTSRSVDPRCCLLLS